MSLILGTRIYGNFAKYTDVFYCFSNWCRQALKYANYIVVATDNQNFAKIKRIIRDLGEGERVYPLLVNPWKGIVNPLNMIIYEANILGADHIMFQSLEVYISFRDFEILASHLTSDTLVVGAKMISTHGEDPGTKIICGMTSPWNTLALWNLPKLNATGFLGISSGIVKSIPGGMEEVVTISLLQKLYPNEAHAKLVSISDLLWIPIWDNIERENDHKEKIITKSLRAEAQLKYLRIEPGYVIVF
jgi:hypothetical protein